MPGEPPPDLSNYSWSSGTTDDETRQAETAKSLTESTVLVTSSNDSSPQHGQSMQPEACQLLPPEVSPKVRDFDAKDSVTNLNEVSPNVRDDDVQDTVKSLNDKLCTALLTIDAKQEFGLEQAEAEVALLETASQKNTSLEDQVSHLDYTRQAREEHEKKICDAVAKKSKELESEKSELQNHISEVQPSFLQLTNHETTIEKSNQQQRLPDQFPALPLEPASWWNVSLLGSSSRRCKDAATWANA
ncbi:hypothetical protein U9M48_000321 [Paspalum notatum var. saurae]|uniref:Uncharacterized protein n=1 Tax=Paspalum notatum var. saurae TaxID=547442 RepID=A0AAQ3SEH9_PASNO